MAIQLEAIHKIYVEQSVQAKSVLADASSFLEELAQRIGTLKKHVLFNPHAETIPLHVSKLTQVHSEMHTLERDLQNISPKNESWQNCQDNIQQLSTQSIAIKEKIEELSYILSTRTIPPHPVSQSIFDGFSPSASPSSSLTLKDLMAFDISAPESHRLTKLAEKPPESAQVPEDSDEEDGYPEEIPEHTQHPRLSSLTKKSRSIESGLKALLAESEHRDLEEDSLFGFDDVDAGQSIGIHIDYIQTRAALFNDQSPRDLDYPTLDAQLSMTYRHAGKFLHTVRYMTPIQLRVQGLDPISLSDVLQTLTRSLRIMHAGGRRAIDNPKNPAQAKIYTSFIERDCVRIECVTKRVLEKIKDIELSLTPLITVIDHGTRWSFPSVLTRLIIQYLADIP